MARFLIVEARFYSHLNDMLIAGARDELEEKGHEVEVVTVPGALEIPAAIALAAESGQYEGYVGIGVVIRGETYHFEIVAGESARGIMALTMDGICTTSSSGLNFDGALMPEGKQMALLQAPRSGSHSTLPTD